MLKRIAAAGALSLALFGLAAPALSQDKAQIKAEQARIESFVISNTVFTLYHEMGHLLVDHLDLPVLGREEDAADNIASYMLLQDMSFGNRRIMEESALSWRMSGGSRGSSFGVQDYYDEHSFDLQRSFQMVCMMVGRDSNAFRAVANEWRLDSDRRERCKDEYAQLSSSLEGLFAEHPVDPATQPSVEIIFESAPSRLQHTFDILRGSFALERVAEDLRTKFGLERDVVIRAEACDQINAFYNPWSSEIIYCYELADEFEQQILEQRELFTR